MVSEPAAAPPIVSVIVPVWNVEPYLRECLDSVTGQTIGLANLEILAVDDGSTDASGAILDEYAARHPQVRVFHEPNSGGPGRPRNIGLDHASGRFVFFLDADDYLGPEALERLVALAERNDADIVLPRIVGIDGRRLRGQPVALDGDVNRVPLEIVFGSTNVLKLFRRSFLERSGLRFGVGVPGGEDGDFMARTYLAAGVISNLGSYPSYFARGRERSQTRRADRTDDLAEYIERIVRERMPPIIDGMQPGPRRDRLLGEELKKVATMLGRRWRALEADDRRRAFEAGADAVRRWTSPGLRRSMPTWLAIRLYCLEHQLLSELEDIVATPPEVAFDNPRIEGRHVYARWPHFRDGSGIPDECFDITPELVPQASLDRATLGDRRLELAGEAFLRLVGGAATIDLRRWPVGSTWSHPTTAVATPDLRTPARDYPNAGFMAAIDLATVAGGRPLPDGTWTIHVTVGTAAVHRSMPLAPRSWEHIATGDRRETDTSSLYRTGAGMLRLRIGPPSTTIRVAERIEAGVLGASRRLVRLAARSPLRALVPRSLRGSATALAGRLGSD